MSNRNIEIKTMLKINGVEITSSDSRTVSSNIMEENVLEIKNSLLNSNLSFIQGLLIAEERAMQDSKQNEVRIEESKRA